MGSIIVGPETARRILAIHAPHVRANDVGHQEIVLDTGTKMRKLSPEYANLGLNRYSQSYLITASTEDNQDLERIGLQADPNIFA